MEIRNFDKPFDCIVLGIGGMGSAALMAAAKRGWQVLGIDRFGVAHDRGSSHGQSRIIRTAYFEHPNYVPLAQQSYGFWESIQKHTDKQLLKQTGLVQVGPAESDVIAGTLSSINQWKLDVEQLTPQAAMGRFPAMRIPGDHTVLLEQQAGFLRVEWCVATMCKAALSMGAQIATGHAVTSWQVADDGLVHVQGQSIRASTERLIVCAGPWSGSLLRDVDLDLKVIRKQQLWYQLDRTDIKAACGFPCFLFDTPEGTFYGFPQIDHLGMKVAEHSGGELLAGPDELGRAVSQQEARRTEAFLESHFEYGRCQRVHDSPCMYTKSTDEHFIIDTHPKYPQISFATGMSGHGFKFAPVIGERLVGLIEGEPDEQMDFLQLAKRQVQVAG